jgi:hypothetical protein
MYTLDEKWEKKCGNLSRQKVKTKHGKMIFVSDM